MFVHIVYHVLNHKHYTLNNQPIYARNKRDDSHSHISGFTQFGTTTELDLSLVHEFVFKDTGEQSSIFSTRFMNAGETPVPEDVWQELREKMERMGAGVEGPL